MTTNHTMQTFPLGMTGGLSVLAHEDAGEFAALLAALIEDHQPVGMTERQLVEELATIIWRKRRVLQAEAARVNTGLKAATHDPRALLHASAPLAAIWGSGPSDLPGLLAMTPEARDEGIRSYQADLKAAHRAMAILHKNGSNAYDKALAALLPESRDWWMDHVEGEEYTANAEGLLAFIQLTLEPISSQLLQELQLAPALKAQVIGAGLQPDRLEKLVRYEDHLDRKFERTLAMLLKLRELRGRAGGSPPSAGALEAE